MEKGAPDNFARLEKALNALLDDQARLRRENLRLREEVETMRKRIDALEGEKGLVKDKIDSLIARLDALI